MSDEHFHSGDNHILYDGPEAFAEAELDPENACIECGEDAFNFRCACCGFPLCSKHNELGAGFCSSNTNIGGVPVCIYDHEIYIGAGVRRDPYPKVLVDRRRDGFCLPVSEGERAPLCRPQQEAEIRVSATIIGPTERELCPGCATEARKQYGESAGGADE